MKVKVVPYDEYYTLTGDLTTNSESLLLVTERKASKNLLAAALDRWIACRLDGSVTRWETYGKGALYYWINGDLTQSIDEFVLLMSEKYPDDLIWLLFHPELFEGRYEP